MKRKIIIGAIIIPCLVFFSSCQSTKTISTDSQIETNKELANLKTQIQKIGKKYTQKTNIPGVAVAVIENGKLAWIQCIGYADKESKKPVTPETIFNVGSVSKLVAAWGLMQLVEQKKMSLDDSVNPYLKNWKIPDTSFDVTKVTLRRLLSHTAGLSVLGYGGSDFGNKLLSLEESLVGKTKRTGEKVKLIMEPGTQWRYSGGGYTVAQLLLEDITQEKFAAYMRKNVFEQLGLNATNYNWTEDMLAQSATAYDLTGKPIKNRIFTEQAAAGLQTTITDLVRIAELSITADSMGLNHVLTPATLGLMQQRVQTTNNDSQHGIGYRLLNFSNFTTIGHTGENEGWCASMFLHLPTKSGLVILCNGSSGKKDVRNPIYEAWVDWVKGKMKYLLAHFD